MYVKYKLYRGGGDCDRKQFHFTNENVHDVAKQSDYVHSGYDQGHLCNAEDFANDCRKEELTFRFYNCIPQTPNLNRGIWKGYEQKIRKLSQIVY
jgi:endonuclease G